jgi:DNA repair protein RadA/Sms
VRPVAQAAARLKEAAKLGFTRAFAADMVRGDGDPVLALTPVDTLANLVADIAAQGRGPRRGAAGKTAQGG